MRFPNYTFKVAEAGYRPFMVSHTFRTLSTCVRGAEAWRYDDHEIRFYKDGAEVVLPQSKVAPEAQEVMEMK